MKHGQELEALVARARALDEEITRANAVSASQQQAIDQLVADVESYNATTKRFDISVERAVFITPGPDDPAQDRTQALQGFGGQPVYYRMSSGTGKCPANPPNAPFGYLCWLEPESSGCNPQMCVCSYRCIKIISSPLEP
jgi:hypothetical protein